MTATIQAFIDCEAKDFAEAFYKNIKDIQQSIAEEVKLLVGDDESETARIEAIFLDTFNNAVSKHQKSGIDFFDCLNDEVDDLVSNGVSPKEYLVSQLIYHSGMCAYSFANGELNDAFAFFALANKFLGVYQGHNYSELMNQKQRREFYQNAAFKRHAENIVMKELAIQYYKENYKNFVSKDEAAMNIAGKILPVAFSTARGWLKGVNPE